MKFKYLRVSLIALPALCLLLPFGALAQSKILYTSLEDALQSQGKLSGNPGPQSVNWTDGGNKYSFINNDEIRSMDARTQKDELVFTNKGLKYPGTQNDFSYESFQWSHDSKHLVFKTNFRPIYRRSGIADYFIYDIGSKQLKQAAKDARSAELSPDGSKVGIERGGNMYVYNFATAKETPLTNDQ